MSGSESQEPFLKRNADASGGDVDIDDFDVDDKNDNNNSSTINNNNIVDVDVDVVDTDDDVVVVVVVDDIFPNIPTSAMACGFLDPRKFVAASHGIRSLLDLEKEPKASEAARLDVLVTPEAGPSGSYHGVLRVLL